MSTTGQQVFASLPSGLESKQLPPPPEHVMPGIAWGRADALFTPAYWAAQAWRYRIAHPSIVQALRVGRTLREEVAACLLGGHGISAEVSHAAFEHLRRLGLFDEEVLQEPSIEAALRQPIVVSTRLVHYRFPRAKARYLAASLKYLREHDLPLVPHSAFRDALSKLPGIGLKTASWIARNWLGSDEVAIIDIHTYRAGLLMGLYESTAQLPRDYTKMETAFLRFAHALDESPTLLDIVIWSAMRSAPSVVRGLLSADTSHQAR